MIHLIAATAYVPYPSWLNPADNTWQMTAATFVGLMSLPGLAVLYASIVPKKWAVNVLAMMFAGFSLVLVAWFVWEYQLGFGSTSLGGGVKVVNGVVTRPRSAGTSGTWPALLRQLRREAGARRPARFSEQGQAVSAANTVIPFHFPTATLAYFQFVFAAITPLLFLGSVLGRIKFSAWCLLVPLWSTFVYCVDAFLLWGGGYFAQEGALDFSGGYVIHMSAGVSGFVAAWVLGPRLLRDRQHALPNNLVMAAVGAGILWLGWNGFNGGDPYYAGAERRVGRRQHQPRHRHRRARLDAHGRLAHQGEEAHLPRRCQRHDLRPGRHHTVRRLGQRLGCHRRRCDLLRRRLGGLELPLQGAARSPRWTTPSASSTPTASPASSAACCSASSVTRT